MAMRLTEPLIDGPPSALEIRLRESMQSDEKVLLTIQDAFEAF